MTDESKDVVRKMLDYLYTGDYSELLNESPTDSAEAPPMTISALHLHAQLFAIGEKYYVLELCDAVAEKYLNRVETYFDPLEFFDSIPDIFYSPINHNRALRELVVRFSRDNLESLLWNTNSTTQLPLKCRSS